MPQIKHRYPLQNVKLQIQKMSQHLTFRVYYTTFSTVQIHETKLSNQQLPNCGILGQHVNNIGELYWYLEDSTHIRIDVDQAIGKQQDIKMSQNAKKIQMRNLIKLSIVGKEILIRKERDIQLGQLDMQLVEQMEAGVQTMLEDILWKCSNKQKLNQQQTRQLFQDLTNILLLLIRNRRLQKFAMKQPQVLQKQMKRQEEIKKQIQIQKKVVELIQQIKKDLEVKIEQNKKNYERVKQELTWVKQKINQGEQAQFLDIDQQAKILQQVESPAKSLEKSNLKKNSELKRYLSQFKQQYLKQVEQIKQQIQRLSAQTASMIQSQDSEVIIEENIVQIKQLKQNLAEFMKSTQQKFANYEKMIQQQATCFEQI